MLAETPALLFTTRSGEVDAVLRGVIAALEAALPGRVRGYYLGGSYAHGNAVAASDVDVYVVFRGIHTAAEAAAVAALEAAHNRLSELRLELVPRSDAQLLREGSVGFKLGSRPLWGEDIRDTVALQPLLPFLEDVARGCEAYSAILRGSPPELPATLDYPDPGDQFFGYLRYGIRTDDGWATGTRTLLNGVSLGATWLVGRRHGIYIVSKAAAIEAYAQHIGGEWAPFVEQLYRRGKLEWGYYPPAGAQERLALRELCRLALGFENHLREEIRSAKIRE